MSTLTLKDGRILAYAEYGNSDGKPVFFFHGMPGSRLFCPSEEITKTVGVRLICVDRPGYGQSTFQPQRSIPDWPRDIARLADSLGLGKFAVAGHSGGGPYAEACAYALPERVTAAAVISGAGPLDTPGATQGMTALNKFGLTAGHYIPWAMWQVLVWVFYHRRAEDPAADIDRQTGHRPLADEEQISKPEVRQACVLSETEAFHHGLRGLAWDTRLLTRPWAFRLKDIRIPVLLWHGSADDATPVNMGKYVAAQIPNCQARFCDGEAHLLLFPHWHEILTALSQVD
jgi:pimeloyl-ACP methyl ester carboxylesterase